MGTIKVEFDIPNFEKELSINVVIKKDGEVVYTTTPSPSSPVEPQLKKTTTSKKSNSGAGAGTVSGNLMNNFDQLL